MLIVLDTNVLIQDIRSRLSALNELAQYCSSVRAGLFLPEVVEIELVAHIEHEVQCRHADVKKALRRLPREFQHIFNSDAFDREVQALTAGIQDTINGLVETHRLRRIPISAEAARQSIQRSVQRRPPCDANGEEIRDAMIWEAALAAVAQYGGPLILLTEDHGFASDRLNDELAKLKVGFRRYPSIRALLQESVPAESLSDDAHMDVESYIARRDLTDLVVSYIAYDFDGAWDAAVSNVIEGGMMDCILGMYKLTGVSDYRMIACFRRLCGTHEYNRYLIFKAIVCLTAEAFKWERRAPEADPNLEDTINDAPEELRNVLATLPQRVPIGDPERIDLDFGVSGEVVIPEKPVDGAVKGFLVELDPIDGGLKGAARLCRKFELGLPKGILTERLSD
jgi:predicted nucleic acid-binding protein